MHHDMVIGDHTNYKIAAIICRAIGDGEAGEAMASPLFGNLA